MGGAATGGTPGSGGTGSAIAGLIGHWKFNENSGNTAADSSGQNHSLTISGEAALGVTGKTGKGLSLDGAGVASANINLGSLNAMTVGLWVKSTVSGYEPAVGLFEFGASNLIWDDVSNVTWTVSDDSSGAAPPAGAWHHLGASWDAAGTSVELCLDGVSFGVGTGSADSITGPNDLNIGQLGDDTAGFEGVIDDVRIYDRVLSCAEIYAAAQ